MHQSIYEEDVKENACSHGGDRSQGAASQAVSRNEHEVEAEIDKARGDLNARMNPSPLPGGDQGVISNLPNDCQRARCHENAERQPSLAQSIAANQGDN